MQGERKRNNIMQRYRHLYVSSARWLWRAGALLLLIGAAAGGMGNMLWPSPAAAQAPQQPHEQQAERPSGHWCQCVEYVLNRYGLSMAGGPYFLSAADMAPYLHSRGFGKVVAPTPGDIIVFSRSFGEGIDPTHGHVGVVRSATPLGDGVSWTVHVRGARQGGASFAEAGCANVSDMTVIVRSLSARTAFFRYGNGNTAGGGGGGVIEPTAVPTAVPTAIPTSTPIPPTPTPSPSPTVLLPTRTPTLPPPTETLQPLRRGAVKPTTGVIEPTAEPTATPKTPSAQPTTVATAPTEPTMRSSWTRQTHLEPGHYRFIARAGGGVRIYLNETCVLDTVGETAPTETMLLRTYPDATTHNIRVEDYGAGGASGGSLTQFRWVWLSDAVQDAHPEP
jgi:hypothetical protein